MSDAAKTADPSAGAAATSELGLLDQILDNTKQTERDRAQELVKTFVEEALSGTVSFDKNIIRTIERALSAIDRKLSAQLNAIMHDPKFLKLEGTWRGLNYLVMNSETGETLKLRVLNATKREITRDLGRASEFDQSQLFKKVYSAEFDTPGGTPYGALIGDYEWTNHPDDINTLRLISNVSAAGFAPFISAPAPSLLGFQDWTELTKPRDIAKIFSDPEYENWRSLRDTEDSRFLYLTGPRVVARLPYGAATKPIDEFSYEEAPIGPDGNPRAMDHHDYCWFNAAYALGARLTDAFAKYGFCTAIRGAEGGGKVENLPGHLFVSEDGDRATKCPTEVRITERREHELSGQGFLALSHYKDTNYAVFFGAQSVQKPKVYDRPNATANSAISARLPYIMATGRFAHYLKVMARDKIGSFMEATDMQAWLDRWIQNYVNTNESAGQEMKARFPLREAQVEVKEIPGKPGAYNAVCWMRPWLQFEQLTARMSMVASLPKRS